MADIGAIKSFIGGLPSDIRLALEQAFTYVLKSNISLGVFEHQTPASNLKAFWLEGTTSSVANQEFTIAHGLESTPTYVIPVLSLNDVNTQIVPLTVSRAADGKRVYLKSSSTSAAIAVLVG